MTDNIKTDVKFTEEELEKMLRDVGANVGYGRGSDPDHIAQIASEWGTRHFRSH